jgi:hypothetical protein
MLALVFLPAESGTSHCLEFAFLINTVLLLGAASAVGKELDIFAIGTVSVNHIFTHQPEIVNNICSYS